MEQKSLEKNVLIISLQGIGNTAILLPAVMALSRRADCKIDIVVSNNGSEQLLLNNPHVGHVYLWDERKTSLQNLLVIGEKLRRFMYDVAYAAYPNWSRENAIILLCRAKKKIGFKCGTKNIIEGLLSMLNGFSIARQENRHDLINNLKLFGLNQEDLGLSSSCFFSSSDEKKQGDILLTKAFINGHKPIIGIHPGSKQYKRWNVDNFANVARDIKQKYPSAWFLIFGGNDENDVMRNLWNRINDCAVMMEDITIRQVAWLVKYCDLFIGNDSMPLHVAALQGIPTVGVFGPTDYRRIGPIGPKSMIIRKDYPCSPCYDLHRNFHKKCKYNIKCIKNISSFQVFEIADKYLCLIMNTEKNADITKIHCGQRYKMEFLETKTLVCQGE